MENSKKNNQIKNTLKTLYHKNHKIMEILRTGSIGSNFTGSYKKNYICTTNIYGYQTCHVGDLRLEALITLLHDI